MTTPATPKLDARQRLLALIVAADWQLDPTATRYNTRYMVHREQDPNAFLKPANHGGTWSLRLDYGAKRSSVTLQKATVHWTPDSIDAIVRGEKDSGRLVLPTWELYRVPENGYRHEPELWTALGVDERGVERKRTLRERAELLVADPDTAIWLALQAEHDAKVSRERATERRVAQMERQERTLPLAEGVSPREWRMATWKLQGVVKSLHDANGETDIAELLDELEAHEMALRNLLDYEALRARHRLLEQEKQALAEQAADELATLTEDLGLYPDRQVSS